MRHARAPALAVAMALAAIAGSLGFLLALPSHARAYGEPVGMLLEPTYALPFPVFLKGGESPVDGKATSFPATLEASINLHVPLTSSLHELDQRDGFAHAFVFIPRVDLRHGLGTSFPIRTPGFYPTVRFQFFHQSHLRPNLRRRWLGELLVAHHSNGQDGCFYRDQIDPSNARCRFADGKERVGAPLNHVDGSFATNELGLRAGADFLLGAPESALSITSLFGLVLFRPTQGGIDPEIEALYGIGRVEAQLRVGKRVWSHSAARSEVGARLRIDARVGKRTIENPVGVLVDGFWSFETLRDWGPFVRAYWGGDYYNVRFDARSMILGLGMMWEA